MVMYKVLLVRRSYDECWVEVPAEDEHDATEKAYDLVGEGNVPWENAVTDEVWVENIKEK